MEVFDEVQIPTLYGGGGGKRDRNETLHRYIYTYSKEMEKS